MEAVFLLIFIILAFKIAGLRKDVDEIQKSLALMEKILLPLADKVSRLHGETEICSSPQAEPAELKSATVLPVAQKPLEKVEKRMPERQTRSFKPVKTEKTAENFTFLGQSLTVWIAAIALMLGVFFLVKYSVENGWLGPLPRLFFCTLFGAGAIFGGIRLNKNDRFENSGRISCALTGAGIAALYFVSYALSPEMYRFVPAGVAFALMCLITAGSVRLALAYGGTPIASLALAGGLLTPSLTGGGLDEPVFMAGYLLVLFVAFSFAARAAASFLLICCALGGVGAWMLFLLAGHIRVYDSFWLIASLVALSVFISGAVDSFGEKRGGSLKTASAGFCLFYAFSLLWKTDFGIFEWAIIGLLLSGILVLTFVRPAEYFKLFIGAQAASLVMMFFWETFNLDLKTFVFGALSFICLVPSYAALWFKGRRAVFIGYQAVCAPLMYAAHYVLFNDNGVLPYVGLTGGILTVLPLLRIYAGSDGRTAKEAGMLVLSSAALLTMALASWVSDDFIPLFLSVEILILGAIRKTGKAELLERGMLALALLFLVATAREAEFSVKLLLFGGLFKEAFFAHFLTRAFFVSYVIVPAAAFGILAKLSKGDSVGQAACAASGFIGFSGAFAFYMLVKMNFDKTVWAKPDFAEQAFLTNVLLAFYACGFYVKKSRAWDVLSALGLWRLIGLSMVLSSPFFSPVETSGASVCFAYGLPAVLAGWYAFKDVEKRKFFSLLGCFLSFVFMSALLAEAQFGTLHIKDFYWDGQAVFAYSALWLFLGIVWLGVAFYNKALEKPAFGLIYLVVAKVFLFDLSSLDGIWRIVSLFVLAGCLLGISHFHAKYFRLAKNGEGV